MLLMSLSRVLMHDSAIPFIHPPPLTPNLNRPQRLGAQNVVHSRRMRTHLTAPSSWGTHHFLHALCSRQTNDTYSPRTETSTFASVGIRRASTSRAIASDTKSKLIILGSRGWKGINDYPDLSPHFTYHHLRLPRSYQVVVILCSSYGTG